jgi:hypothetical protein
VRRVRKVRRGGEVRRGEVRRVEVRRWEVGEGQERMGPRVKG